MTKEILFGLTTGDWVRNVKTNQVCMVAVLSQPNLNIVSVYDLSAVEDWELQKSRLVVTKEELRRLEEYHEKISQKAVKDKLSKKFAVVTGTQVER